MDCAKKVKFDTKDEAQLFITSLGTDGQGLESYICNIHSCWHMGHPKNYDDNPVARINNILDKLDESHPETR